MSGDNQFIDPYNTYVLITSSIKNPEGGNIPAVVADAHNPVCNVLPVNGLGTAWFKKIDVKLNGTTVSFDGNIYSHRVDIENRLSYPDTVKKGHLSMMGFDEEMEAFDEINNADIHWDDADPAEHAYPIDSVSISGKSMLYPVCRVKMMYYSCGANVVELSNFNLLTMEGNLLQCRIIVVMVREDAVHGNYNRDPFNYQHFNLAEFSLKVGSEQIPLSKLKCNIDDDSNDILRPLFSALLANHSLFSNEELGINPSNYRNGNVFLPWDLSQMPPGQSFEMTQEKPVSLILKLRRANNFVINVIVYSEYDSEVEMLNNRKVICHEHAFKKSMQKVKEISLPDYQSVSSSNEYAPICNKKMINIDLNEFRHSLPAKNKNFEIQNEYFTEIHLVMIPNIIQHVPLYPIHPVPELNSHKRNVAVNA